MGKADREVLEARIAEGEKRERKRLAKERRSRMKKKRISFFADFKKFITRGNVLDMAVGVIVGGAFTGIINALSNTEQTSVSIAISVKSNISDVQVLDNETITIKVTHKWTGRFPNV